MPETWEEIEAKKNQRYIEDNCIRVKLKNGYHVAAFPMVIGLERIDMFMFTISRKEKVNSRVGMVKKANERSSVGFKSLYSALREGCLEGLKMR